jgi:hypothetical protein
MNQLLDSNSDRRIAQIPCDKLGDGVRDRPERHLVSERRVAKQTRCRAPRTESRIGRARAFAVDEIVASPAGLGYMAFTVRNRSISIPAFVQASVKDRSEKKCTCSGVSYAFVALLPRRVSPQGVVKKI